MGSGLVIHRRRDHYWCLEQDGIVLCPCGVTANEVIAELERPPETIYLGHFIIGPFRVEENS